VKWSGLFIFLSLFIFAGFLSEQATRQNWEYRKAFNLFENNYRFGSFVFGGGDVLIPMMYEQYVTRPKSNAVKKNKRDVIKLTSTEFLTGSGFVRAIPGPIFSIASYTGAVALKEMGIPGQVLGAVIASMGVFLPSFFIVLFLFPLWQKLKKYAVFYRSLEGIYASIVGIMIGSTFYLLKDVVMQLQVGDAIHWITFPLVFLASTYLLYYQKLAPQWIALSCVTIGTLLYIIS
jgi:chromate transporter